MPKILVILKVNIFILLKAITKAIEKVKGEDVILLNLTHIENVIFDYFVICSANSSTQVSAIARSVEEHVSRDTQEKPLRIEGMANAQWVLMDYGALVLHIFQKSIREHYDLESLWKKATRLEWNEDGQMNKIG